MRLKKLNAALGLFSIVCMLLHMGYTVFAYLTFFYDPVLKLVFAMPFMVVVCLHAVCGMLTVFLQGDGSRMDLYPKQNMGTLIQRVSAALIFPLLILHINTFSLMQVCAGKGQKGLIVLLIAAELLFFAVVIAHVVISLSKGLITLGLLASRGLQRRIDRTAYVLGAAAFVIAAYAVVKVQIVMFLMG